MARSNEVIAPTRRSPTVGRPSAPLPSSLGHLFGVRGRVFLRQRLDLLPPHTAYATLQLLEQVESLDRQVRGFEQRIQAVFKPTRAIQPLLTLPGVGLTLAVVIALEVGDVARFATAEKLAGYAGTTPRVHASGGKTRVGPARPDVNRYLKWAFVEAANPSASRAGAHLAATSVASTSGSLGARATRKRSGRGGPASRRSDIRDVEQRGGLSRTEGGKPFSSTGDQRGGSMSSRKLDR
jgi:transposase